MTPKKLAAFRLDTELIEGLERVKERTGAPIAEQVRRSIQAWLNATPTLTVPTTPQLLVERTGIRFHIRITMYTRCRCEPPSISTTRRLLAPVN